MTAAELPSGIVLSVSSWAKTVKVPAAFRVMEKVLVPELSCAGEGTVALASVASMEIELEMVATVFHPESHARTVMLKGNPETCWSAVPVLPDEVPGAAVSPGSST